MAIQKPASQPPRQQQPQQGPKSFAEQIKCPESFKQTTGMCVFFGALTYYEDAKRDRIAIRSVKHDGAFIMFKVRKPLLGDTPHVFSTTDLERHLRDGNDGVGYLPVRGKMTLLPQFSKRYVALPGESLVCPMKLALDEADFANARKERAKWNKQIKETAKFLIEDKLIDVPKLTEFSDRIAQTFTTWKMAYGNAFDKVLLKIASAVKKVKEQPKSVFEVLAQWHKHVTDARNLCECGGVVILTNRNPRNWHCFTCGRNYVDIKVRMPCGKGGGPPAPRREA